MGMLNRSIAKNASTTAAVFDTNYSSPAVAPAKTIIVINEIR